jgi:hypothetical protein
LRGTPAWLLGMGASTGNLHRSMCDLQRSTREVEASMRGVHRCTLCMEVSMRGVHRFIFHIHRFIVDMHRSMLTMEGSMSTIPLFAPWGWKVPCLWSIVALGRSALPSPR